jgi:hypothetical protein
MLPRNLTDLVQSLRQTDLDDEGTIWNKDLLRWEDACLSSNEMAAESYHQFWRVRDEGNQNWIRLAPCIFRQQLFYSHDLEQVEWDLQGVIDDIGRLMMRPEWSGRQIFLAVNLFRLARYQLLIRRHRLPLFAEADGSELLSVDRAWTLLVKQMQRHLKSLDKDRHDAKGKSEDYSKDLDWYTRT